MNISGNVEKISGTGNDSSLGMSSLTLGGFHMMTVNKISRNGQGSVFSFRIIQCWVILTFTVKMMIVDVGCKKTRLILLEEFLVLLLGLGDPG